MAINMRVLSIRDDEVASVAADPKCLDHQPLKHDVAELHDHWREVDYVLGGQSFIMKGDTVIKQSKNEPIHAIRSSNVPSLAAALNALSGNELRHRLDPVRMREAGLWVPEYPGYIERLLPPVSTALDKLRELVQSAASQGKGLIVQRYEWL
jgi:hypothetical protein